MLDSVLTVLVWPIALVVLGLGLIALMMRSRRPVSFRFKGLGVDVNIVPCPDTCQHSHGRN